MRHTFLSIRFVLIIVICLSCLDTQAQRPSRKNAARRSQNAGPRFAIGKSALRIPLEIDNNVILLRVRVNDSEPLRFVFDTGASISVISPELAAKLRIKAEGQVRGTATGGSIEASLIKGVKLSVTGAEVSNQLIAAISFGKVPCFEFDGIIGYDFINQFVAEIDYVNSVLNLYDPQSYSYSGKGEVIPLALDGRRTPLMPAKIIIEGSEPVVANLEIDTGGDGTFIIDNPFVEKHKLLAAIPNTVDGSTVGAGGKQKQLVGRVKAVQLGKLLIHNPTLALVQDAEVEGANDESQGTIGAEVFRRFKVIIDYSRKQMILEANKSFSEPYEVGMSGINFVIDEKDCKVLRIDSIRENSAAVEAGLQPGDIITAIDGTSTQTLSSIQLKKIFKQNGKPLALTVQRGPALLAKRITLKRLI